MPTLPGTFKRKAIETKPRPKRDYPCQLGTWKKVRAHQLRIEPLCRPCVKAGRYTTATQVDHIDGNSNNNTPENYQSICADCHNRKSAQEHGFKKQ